jgi:hypothetical protein
VRCSSSENGTSATSRDARVKSEMRTKTEIELPPITRILGGNGMSALRRKRTLVEYAAMSALRH